ncbi:MAG: hypothetical protein A2017_12340 [Lentisphaerae bacterium GWF2_44_16]|nr:MAG: hypothetical protein A2017_12340 [Lentisphaerae bacterium GWF2_44_16]
MDSLMNENDIMAIERPVQNLLKLYFIYSILTGPGFFLMFPVLFFRYHTLRYRFDKEGISMKWGILFRREINLNYSRIQDIHLTSGIIQRWFGLADIQIQTASGNAAAEMVIEGIPRYEELRNYLYTKMRGYKVHSDAKTHIQSTLASGENTAAILNDILSELRASRTIMEKISNSKKGSENV